MYLGAKHKSMVACCQDHVKKGFPLFSRQRSEKILTIMPVFVVAYKGKLP